jgi:uncharacterized protein with PQ loop repeat
VATPGAFLRLSAADGWRCGRCIPRISSRPLRPPAENQPGDDRGAPWAEQAAHANQWVECGRGYKGVTSPTLFQARPAKRARRVSVMGREAHFDPPLKMKKRIQLTIQSLLILDGFFAGVPQVHRILERGSSADVSILSWAWMSVMASLWVYQAVRDRSPVLLWSSVIWGLNNLTVAIVAAIYRH